MSLRQPTIQDSSLWGGVDLGDSVELFEIIRPKLARPNIVLTYNYVAIRWSSGAYLSYQQPIPFTLIDEEAWHLVIQNVTVVLPDYAPS